MYFSTYGLRKTWIDKCLKSPVSEARATSKMVNALKHCPRPNNSTLAPLPYLLISVQAIEVEKVSLSDMQNLRTVC